MKNMKVAIIGAGICGLYLSSELARNGYKVVVFEAKGGVGEKRCSALYSERIYDFIPESKGFIENKIDYSLLHFPKKDIRLSFKKEFWVIDRKKLEKFLYKESLKNGTKFFFRTRIEEIPPGFDRVIGCEGSFSITREKIKIKKPKRYFAFLGNVKERNFSRFVENWPLKNRGFIWKIPRGNSTEYGIIGESPRKVKETFERFLKNSKIKLESLNPAVISSGFALPSQERVTLCGESAGLTKPWSGGGVIWGLKSASILLKTFPDFLKYKRQTTRFFLPKILVSERITKMVYILGFRYPFLLPAKIKIDNDFLL